jgi:hypothetical protein
MPNATGEPQNEDAETRQRMIAEAAYYRAQRRGFRDGDTMHDWLEAEAEIDHRAGPSFEEERADEVAAYQRLRREVTRLLGEVRGTATADAVRDAVDTGVRDLRGMGTHTAETVSRVAAALRKDIASTAERMGPRWESFSEKSAGLFGVWRDRGTEFLGQAADAVTEWLVQARKRRGAPVYHAGEMSGGGTFECVRCGEHVVLHEPGHLPRCPQCGGGEFRRQ